MSQARKGVGTGWNGNEGRGAATAAGAGTLTDAQAEAVECISHWQAGHSDPDVGCCAAAGSAQTA